MKQEKAQHTQGPWSYEMAKEMLRPFDSGIDTNHPESEANARLIEAAPLLLEALRLVMLDHDVEGIELNHDTVTAARAAIAATQQ